MFKSIFLWVLSLFTSLWSRIYSLFRKKEKAHECDHEPCDVKPKIEEKFVEAKRVLDEKSKKEVPVLFSCLNYLTEEEKETILEAVSFSCINDITNGWRPMGSGMYRIGYLKNGIVVKFDKKTETSDREIKFYLSLPSSMRKYLARIYFATPNKIIQRYAAPIDHDDNKMKRKADSVAKKLGLSDAWWSHNMGVCNGKPVVFDWNVGLP